MGDHNDHFSLSLDLRVFSSRSSADIRSFHKVGHCGLSRQLPRGKHKCKVSKLTRILVISIMSSHNYFTYKMCMVTTHIEYILERCELYFCENKW
jgi:hypothetical protein